MGGGQLAPGPQPNNLDYLKTWHGRYPSRMINRVDEKNLGKKLVTVIFLCLGAMYSGENDVSCLWC